MRIIVAGLCFVSLLCFTIRAMRISSQPVNTPRNSGIIQLCGFRDSGQDQTLDLNRIVGGGDAEKNEFKWQVSIMLKYHGSKKHHTCGGTIIGQSWIVTAAHCTKHFSTDQLVFVAGDHRLYSTDGSEQLRESDLFIEHEDYDSLTQQNDISLVRTTKPFDFTTLKVAPACLPNPAEEFSGSCVVTGWGKLKEGGGKNSGVLQKVWLPIISDEKCKKRLRKLNYDQYFSKNMICAGFDAGRRDACQGDSGGPLICPDKGKFPILVGLVSWGIGCARRNVPGVYTEVSHFVDWINKNVKKHTRLSTKRGPFADKIIPSKNQQHTKKVQGYHPPQHPVKGSHLPLHQEQILGTVILPETSGSKASPSNKYLSSEESSSESDESDSSEEK